MTTHKQWLDNEYRQWIDALNESTVDNFKDHPMVQRMLSEDVEWEEVKGPDFFKDIPLLKIDNIGRSKEKFVSGACWRMAHYALKVLLHNPTSIIEIGGGVGQFFVILIALGYKGKYYIADLPEVKEFQRKYFIKAAQVLGIDFHIYTTPPPTIDFICSFYAIGEFTDETKAEYLPLIKQAPHGLILWNPHSGASEEVPFECTVTDEFPKTSPNVKMLQW